MLSASRSAMGRARRPARRAGAMAVAARNRFVAFDGIVGGVGV